MEELLAQVLAGPWRIASTLFAPELAVIDDPARLHTAVEEAEFSVPGRAAGGDKVRLPGIERHPCEEGDAVDVEKRARIRPAGKCGGKIGDGEAEEGERQHGECGVGEEAGACGGDGHGRRLARIGAQR